AGRSRRLRQVPVRRGAEQTPYDCKSCIRCDAFHTISNECAIAWRRWNCRHTGSQRRFLTCARAEWPATLYSEAQNKKRTLAGSSRATRMLLAKELRKFGSRPPARHGVRGPENRAL